MSIFRTLCALFLGVAVVVTSSLVVVGLDASLDDEAVEQWEEEDVDGDGEGTLGVQRVAAGSAVRVSWELSNPLGSEDAGPAPQPQKPPRRPPRAA